MAEGSAPGTVMMRRIHIFGRSKNHDTRMADLRTDAVVNAMISHLIR